MTRAQKDWLDRHPQFERVTDQALLFANPGTLYANGRFEAMPTLRPARIEEGSFAVGVRVNASVS